MGKLLIISASGVYIFWTCTYMNILHHWMKLKDNWLKTLQINPIEYSY